MIDVHAIAAREQKIGLGQCRIVGGRHILPERVVAIQITEFYSQHRGLHFIQPGIHTRNIADISIPPAVFAE